MSNTEQRMQILHTFFKGILVATFLSYWVSQPIRSAELNVSRSTDGTVEFELTGTIKNGDTEKIASKILTFAHPPGRVSLKSDGGDVGEAMRIAELFRTLRIATSVKGQGSCASACFLVWLAGSNRFADVGSIGIHRPYLASPDNSSASLSAQSKVFQAVSNYLQTQLVPQRLIDLMLQRPSNEIYWLSQSDLNELREFPADIEELYIAKCKFSLKKENELFRRKIAAEKRGDFSVDPDMKAWEDGPMTCRVDLDIAGRIAGMQKIKSGWLPANAQQNSSPTQEKLDPKAEERKVEKAHPKWKKLVQTGAFTRWLSAQPPSIADLAKSNSASDAIQMLELYKRDIREGR